MNVVSHFMFLIPELAGYERIAPYSFVSFADEGFGEIVLTPLHDDQALFLAIAWILRAGRQAQLEPYPDVTAFACGDLFYLQELVAALDNYSLVEGTRLYLPTVISGSMS